MLNLTLETVGESKFGWMVQDMKVTGRITRQMAEEDLFTQMAMFMKENGRMIKLMGKECTPMLMDQDTRVTGVRTSNTDKELRNGQMVLLTKVNTTRVKSMEEALLHGLTNPHLPVSSKTTILMVMVFMSGLMAECTRETGRITRWKGMVHSHGPMADSTLENMLMI